MLQNASRLFITISTILFLFTSQNSFADDNKPATISLSGTGSVSIAPDMAIVSFGVVKEAKTARLALDENNKAMASVLTAMEENGIDKKDLQTSGFNIQPKYFYPKRKSNGEQPSPEITGYRVSNNLTIRIRELEKAGEILDLSVTLGINSGGNIQFTNEDTSSMLKEARSKAVTDAVEKAQTLSVQEDASVPIASGENTYQVTVQMSWEISQ